MSDGRYGSQSENKKPQVPNMSVANSNVVVVGGGIIGASIAWHLSSETNVTIIAEDIGGVATPNSFAWLNAASSDKKFYYDFRLRSLEHWREIEKAVENLPIHWGGTTSWDKSPRELEEEQKNLTAWGYDVIRVDKTGISKREPRIEETKLPEWGLGYDQEGALEAEKAAELLINLAKDSGAKVLETKVKGFTKTDGESLSKKAVKTRTKMLGEEHSDTLTSMANLAWTYWHQGRYKEAEELLRPSRQHKTDPQETNQRCNQRSRTTHTSNTRRSLTFRFKLRWRRPRRRSRKDGT
uniref:FAD dependent oxidoreductase domain-containing protein n=1 Tax=Fusarium oxysporum (strain Fo5176) TaxID=660025 RepID=A0A0D2XYN8_FUSOF